MDTISLTKLNFLESCGFNKISPLMIPDSKGVYVISNSEYLKRKVGSSDILYIGSSNNLLRRIFGNYIGGIGGKTTQRIHNKLFGENYINNTKISWIIVDDYKNKEKQLRNIYTKEHGELPPWNHQN